MRKVIKFEICLENKQVSIRYDDDSFFLARISPERLASLIENEVNASNSEIVLTESEILSQDGYDEYLDETDHDENNELHDFETDPIGDNPDADWLASAGFGTDEDYGSYGDDSGW